MRRNSFVAVSKEGLTSSRNFYIYDAYDPDVYVPKDCDQMVMHLLDQAATLILLQTNYTEDDLTSLSHSLIITFVDHLAGSPHGSMHQDFAAEFLLKTRAVIVTRDGAYIFTDSRDLTMLAFPEVGPASPPSWKPLDLSREFVFGHGTEVYLMARENGLDMKEAHLLAVKMQPKLGGYHTTLLTDEHQPMPDRAYFVAKINQVTAEHMRPKPKAKPAPPEWKKRLEIKIFVLRRGKMRKRIKVERPKVKISKRVFKDPYYKPFPQIGTIP